MTITRRLPDTELDKEIIGPQGKTIIFTVEYDRETGKLFTSIVEQFDNSEFYGKLVGMIAGMRNDSITRKRSN